MNEASKNCASQPAHKHTTHPHAVSAERERQVAVIQYGNKIIMSRVFFLVFFWFGRICSFELKTHTYTHTRLEVSEC